jgi:hypothetical protein
MEVAAGFIVPVEFSVTFMKRMCAHSRLLTRASQLASRKRGVNEHKAAP